MPWVVSALEKLGGAGSVLDVSKVVWAQHKDDLAAHGDLFFTWQYDIRWAAQKLRDSGVLVAMKGRRNTEWQLAEAVPVRDDTDAWALEESESDPW